MQKEGMEPTQAVMDSLVTLRQNPERFQLDPLVADLLQIWLEIHQQAIGAGLDDLMPISKRILEKTVLPIYEKYANDPALQKVRPWLDSYASIVLKWQDRGSYLIPLNLVAYEICYHKKGMLQFFLRRLVTKEIYGTREEFFDFLAPILTNFIVPLDDVDIGILKARILLEQDPLQFSRSIPHEAYTPHVEMSSRNIIRRLNRLSLLDILSTVYILDMGQLGFETSLLFHTNDFPEKYQEYLLSSATIPLGNFSVVQIPYKKTSLMQQLHESLESFLIYPLERRVMNWNLTGLASGDDPWQKPPSLLYGLPRQDIISPSPRMDMSLEPYNEPFPITPADIRILDFLSSQGEPRNLASLSKAIKVSTKTISKAFQQYKERQLLVRTTQFFNLGLDLSIFFFLSIKDDSIPWIDHFLTFPKVDVFVHKDKDTTIYTGFVKIPHKWIKLFSRNMDKTIRALRDKNLKFYHKILSSVDHAKWGLQLAKTL